MDAGDFFYFHHKSENLYGVCVVFYEDFYKNCLEAF